MGSRSEVFVLDCDLLVSSVYAAPLRGGSGIVTAMVDYWTIPLSTIGGLALTRPEGMLKGHTVFA